MARLKDTITIPRKEYERLKKDLRRAKDEAKALAKIAEAERDLREGRVREVKDLRELMRG